MSGSNTWGVGQRVFFLHDGRTSNLVEAIRDHKSRGSEANKVIEHFDRLSTQEQQKSSISCGRYRPRRSHLGHSADASRIVGNPFPIGSMEQRTTQRSQPHRNLHWKVRFRGRGTIVPQTRCPKLECLLDLPGQRRRDLAQGL